MRTFAASGALGVIQGALETTGLDNAARELPGVDRQLGHRELAQLEDFLTVAEVRLAAALFGLQTLRGRVSEARKELEKS